MKNTEIAAAARLILDAADKGEAPVPLFVRRIPNCTYADVTDKPYSNRLAYRHHKAGRYDLDITLRELRDDLNFMEKAIEQARGE